MSEQGRAALYACASGDRQAPETTHLRPRTNVIGAATRARHTLAQAIHRFFDENGFFWVNTPIITSAGAEGAGALFTKAYTFGPTFRAENFNTSRHLAEFWMIEPEIAFADLSDNATLAERLLKFTFDALLKERQEDLAFFDERIEKGLVGKLQG